MNFGLSNLITGSAGVAAGLWQNYQNNKMMQKQMDYNTSEREASQRYNTSEREASQQYQTSEREAQNKYNEDMYNKYSSPQAMVEQYKAAGLNPRLAANGDGLGTSVSGGSNGGAPSGAAPSGTHINPPYQNMSAMADSFSSLAKGLSSIADAKKAGVETDFYEKTFKSRVAQVLKSEALQDLEIDAKALNNKNAQKAFEKLEVEIQKEHMNLDVIEKQLDILDKEGAIKGYEKETWKERFKNEQENLKAGTANKDADTLLKQSQKALTDIMQQVEKEKPAVYRSLAALQGYQAESARIASEIANATELSEVQAIRARNGKTLEHVTAEIRNLNAQAELALRNKDYTTWDRINGTISAIGGLGMLFMIGKQAFKKAAPILTPPAAAFTTQFNNPQDLNTYGQGSNIWY